MAFLKYIRVDMYVHVYIILRIMSHHVILFIVPKCITCIDALLIYEYISKVELL